MFLYVTNAHLGLVQINEQEILSLIRGINHAKSGGPDEISGRMLILCDTSLVYALKLIFENVLSTGIYHQVLYTWRGNWISGVTQLCPTEHKTLPASPQ